VLKLNLKAVQILKVICCMLGVCLLSTATDLQLQPYGYTTNFLCYMYHNSLTLSLKSYQQMGVIKYI